MNIVQSTNFIDQKIVNKKNHWGDLWTKELKEELDNAKDNTNVGHNLVMKNDRVIIWSIHLPAGKRMPFHSHKKPYFWTALTEGMSRSFFDDGSIVETTYKIDDTKYFQDLNNENYFTHNLENIGNTNISFLTIEFV